MKIRFTKAVATGNDFVIVDDRGSRLGARGSGLARKICDRKHGIGADGLLLLERSKKADFRMRIFNPDGSEAEMCGNGSRCAALYAKVMNIAGRAMSIETRAGIIDARVDGNMVSSKLTRPEDMKLDFCVEINRCPYELNFVNTGVPHVVYFVKDLEVLDVKNIGQAIRNHPRFSPHGANVDFVRIIGKNSIGIRTYERGVEDETLACGTGAAASALISAKSADMRSPVTVKTRGGEILKVYFESDNGSFRDVHLEGKAHLVFDGVINTGR